MNKVRRSLVGTVIVIGVLIIALVCHSIVQRKHAGEDGDLARSVANTSTVAVNTPEVIRPDIEDHAVVDLDDIRKEATRMGTVGELLAKGFPIMSNPRVYVYNHTASQSIPELVADLGYQPTIEMSSIMTDQGTGIAYYRRRIMRHVKVVRLIQEGRQRPNDVVPLLESSLRNALSSFDSVTEAEGKEIQKLAHDERPAPESSDNDPYYAQHHRYKDPVLEFMRLQDVIYSDFYILTSLDRPASPKLVAEWVAKVKRPGHELNDMDMNLWLISQAYKDRQLSNTNGAKRFKAAMASWNDMEAESEIPVWNAIWDPKDPLILATHVNTSDIQRIKVPSIPESRAPGTNDVKQTLVREFIEAVKRMPE